MIIGATDFPIFVDIKLESQHGGAASKNHFLLEKAKKAIVKSEYKTKIIQLNLLKKIK